MHENGCHLCQAGDGRCSLKGGTCSNSRALPFSPPSEPASQGCSGNLHCRSMAFSPHPFCSSCYKCQVFFQECDYVLTRHRLKRETLRYIPRLRPAILNTSALSHSLCCSSSIPGGFFWKQSSPFLSLVTSQTCSLVCLRAVGGGGGWGGLFFKDPSYDHSQAVVPKHGRQG